MLELVKAIRLFGVGYMRKLGRGYRLGWDELIRGYLSTQALHALMNVGLLDQMVAEGNVELERFAESAKVDIRVLRPLCEALYSVGVFAKSGTGEAYRFSEKDRGIFEVLKGWLQLSYGYSEVFNSLEGMLRGDRVYGRDLYRKSDFVAIGSGEMENWVFFPTVNDMILQKGYTRVLDLGCGDGTFLRRLCELNKNVQCFGVDIAPAAVEAGILRTRAAGLENRISFYTANIEEVEAMPEAFRTAQVATIFFILHEILYLGEDRLIAFLKAYRKNFPGVPLIVFEAIRSPADQMRKRPGIGIYYYLFHDLTHQKPVNRETWQRLFRAAGFHSVEERYLGFSQSAIYTLQ